MKPCECLKSKLVDKCEEKIFIAKLIQTDSQQLVVFLNRHLKWAKGLFLKAVFRILVLTGTT